VESVALIVHVLINVNQYIAQLLNASFRGTTGQKYLPETGEREWGNRWM
jgi:hypothetical protein